ncbi:MAG: crossover junction endodeoxyribonuclease RuvC [Clostridiales bacterium]|nr:crossover junction endodeoxyribonuclease RuvC [Clostridiales bacterium]
MRILGIDPGYAIVGYGIIDTHKNNAVVDYGVIETPKEDPLPVRLQTIEEALRVLFETYKPDEVAVEELFYFKNQKTVIQVAQARGVIVLASQKYCGRTFEYTPIQIKQALTGNGRADKKQMQFMVKSVLGLSSIPRPDDAADALAVAICHSQINPNLNFNMMQ